MSGVFALALKRKALSRGTFPRAVPVGHLLDSGTKWDSWSRHPEVSASPIVAGSRPRVAEIE